MLGITPGWFGSCKSSDDNSHVPTNQSPLTHSHADELDELHECYVIAVNEAVAEDDMRRVTRLASDYDQRAMRLIADREGHAA